MTITRSRRSFLFLVVVCAAWGALSLLKPPAPAAPRADARAAAATSSNPSVDATSVAWPASVSSSAQIVRVVDGDTVDALPDGETKVVRVRLLGVNTPETVDPRRPVQCFGKEASAAAKSLLEGKRVALVEDVQADDRDKYGRLLRILVLPDGLDVNATLVARGYAHAYVEFPMRKERKAQLRRLEAEARSAGRGLWDPAACDGKAY